MEPYVYTQEVEAELRASVCPKACLFSATRYPAMARIFAHVSTLPFMAAFLKSDLRFPIGDDPCVAACCCALLCVAACCCVMLRVAARCCALLRVAARPRQRQRLPRSSRSAC
jgi:hypothetical protein